MNKGEGFFAEGGMFHFGKKFNVSIFTLIAVLLVLLCDFSVFTFIVFLCIALHEFAHVVFLHLTGAQIYKVNVYPFGIDIISNMNSLSYKKELLCVLSGPVANLLCAGVGFLWGIFMTSPESVFFLYANLFYGLGNLIPLPFFDGGRALTIILSWWIMPHRADAVLKRFNVILSGIFLIFSLTVFFITKCNLSVVVMIGYTALSCVIFEHLANNGA